MPAPGWIFANWPRLHPNDFKVKSQYGKGLDWPISYDDLLPYYDRIAHDVGISGDAAAEKQWYPVGKDYPMPPLKTFRQGDIFNDAFKAHGIPLAPMPVAINSTPYKDRPACVNCGWCHVGCASGAHGTPLVSHLRDARQRGAEVRPFSYVTRVLTTASGDRVTGVEYYDSKKEQHVQPAGVVVLAAYSAENPRIMLNSATLALIGFARHLGDMSGQIFAVAVMAVAASEVVVGLGLIVALNRNRVALDVDRLNTLHG